MKKQILDLASASLFALILALGGCSNGPKDVVGTGSGTESALIVGHIFNLGGTPAANATVRLIAANQDPRANSSSAATVTTDAAGKYSITSLAARTYNLLAEGTSGKAYRDSIRVACDTLYLYDTLRAPGSLFGVVLLEGGNDSDSVFIVLIGTNYYTRPADTSGGFALPEMAPGTYHALITTASANYTKVDTSLTIVAGQDTSLPAPIFLRRITPGFYFVTNKYHASQSPTYLILKDYASFDSLFHWVENVDSSKLITPAKMQAGFVVAVIYQGTYSMNVTIINNLLQSGILSIYYETTTPIEHPSYTGNNFDMMYIANCTYDSVQFYENNQLVSNPYVVTF